ncbi:hypothetical protein OKW21_000324 [Catalinimonas alkaloidigena]|uniref:hypothetical protein n=1 Tax=Catalinimonas alkaloidigena TaxID=1075417 RepID=UPI0024056DDD|nr:hypothetical protein [Catalinimonas alkaloidigena]MDF9795061.1 hypothetical protein [Catalinimonas alkaloidigena]
MRTYPLLFCCILLGLLLLSHISCGQRQLVVLKYNEVVARFNPGQPFTFKYKASREKVSTYIRDISDTAVVTYDDTVSIHEIDRIYFKQHAFHQTLGAALVIVGVGRFVIDQINNLAVHGNKPSLDSEVNEFSISTVTAGLPMLLIRKKSQKMLYKYKAIIIENDSYLYASPNPEPYPSSYSERGN